MRVTVAHNKSQEDAIGILDRSIDRLFLGAAGGVVQISEAEKSWSGNTLRFSMRARAYFLTAPIKGTMLVTEKEAVVDADLGLFGRFLPEERAKALMESQLKSLLA